MSHTYTNPDEHFLRRFFDTLYEITPENFRNVVTNTPKRVRWLIASTIAGLVLAIVLLQFLNIGLEAIEVANRPTLAERLEAPYGLSTRIVPALTISDEMSEREIPVVDQISAAANADQAIAAAWRVAAEYGEHINEDWVRANFQPSMDFSYFFILPDFQGHTRSYVRNDLATHPTIDCLIGANPRTHSCNLNAETTFAEAADYFAAPDQNGNQAHARMAVAQYSDAETSREVLRRLATHADEYGVLGNFAMGDNQGVSYLQARTARYHIFGWSNQNWLYVISAADMKQIETLIGGFFH